MHVGKLSATVCLCHIKDLVSNLTSTIGMLLHSDPPGIIGWKVVFDGWATSEVSLKFQGNLFRNEINTLYPFPPSYTTLNPG
jgi:hypothetical protein